MIYNFTLPAGVFNYAISQNTEKYIISSITINISSIYDKIKSEWQNNNSIENIDFLQSVNMKYKVVILVNNNDVWHSWDNGTIGINQFKDLNFNNNITINNLDITNKLNNSNIKQSIKCHFEVAHSGFYFNFDSQEYTFLAIAKKPIGLLQNSVDNKNVALVFNNLNENIENSMTENSWIVANQATQQFVIPVRYGESSGFIRHRTNGIGILKYQPNDDIKNINDSFRKRYYPFSATFRYNISTNQYSRYSQTSIREEFDNNVVSEALPLDRYDSGTDIYTHYSYDGWRRTQSFGWGYYTQGSATGIRYNSLEIGPGSTGPSISGTYPVALRYYSSNGRTFMVYPKEWYYNNSKVDKSNEPKSSWYIHDSSVITKGEVLPDDNLGLQYTATPNKYISEYVYETGTWGAGYGQTGRCYIEFYDYTQNSYRVPIVKIISNQDGGNYSTRYKKLNIGENSVWAPNHIRDADKIYVTVNAIERYAYAIQYDKSEVSWSGGTSYDPTYGAAGGSGGNVRFRIYDYTLFSDKKPRIQIETYQGGGYDSQGSNYNYSTNNVELEVGDYQVTTNGSGLRVYVSNFRMPTSVSYHTSSYRRAYSYYYSYGNGGGAVYALFDFVDYTEGSTSFPRAGVYSVISSGSQYSGGMGDTSYRYDSVDLHLGPNYWNGESSDYSSIGTYVYFSGNYGSLSVRNTTENQSYCIGTFKADITESVHSRYSKNFNNWYIASNNEIKYQNKTLNEIINYDDLNNIKYS